MIRELAKTMAEFCFNVDTNRPKEACASGCAVPSLYVNVEIIAITIIIHSSIRKLSCLSQGRTPNNVWFWGAVFWGAARRRVVVPVVITPVPFGRYDNSMAGGRLVLHTIESTSTYSRSWMPVHRNSNEQPLNKHSRLFMVSEARETNVWHTAIELSYLHIGTVQRRSAWPLRKENTHTHNSRRVNNCRTRIGRRQRQLP